MTNTLDLARRRRLAFELVEAHARVLASKEQIQRAYPFVSEENAALFEARAHLVKVQRRYNQFRTSWETTSARTGLLPHIRRITPLSRQDIS